MKNLFPFFRCAGQFHFFSFPLIPLLVNIGVNNMPLPFATRRLGAWLQFLLCVVLLSLLIGFHAVDVDLVFGWLTLAFLVVMSALVVRTKWRHRLHQQGNAEEKSDAGDVILRRIRRWWMDEKKA